MKNLQTLAMDAARAGAAAIRQHTSHRHPVTYKHSSTADPVTAADHASEQAIRSCISRYRSTDGFLGEELGEQPGTSGVRWIVDPLDGTANFVRHIGHYAVSVAAESVAEGRAVAAAVLRPTTGEWLALDAHGAAMTGDGPVRRTDIPARHAVVSFAVPSDPRRRAAGYHALAEIAPHVQDLRNSGSTVCDLLAVATGELDGFVTFSPKPWDVAAGAALVAAAGGVSKSFVSGGQNAQVCGTPAVVEAVLRCAARTSASADVPRSPSPICVSRLALNKSQAISGGHT